MSPASLFRVIVSVTDIDQAAAFYSTILQQPGRRVSEGRHYFDTGSVILACYDPEAEGDDTPHMPNTEPLYFTVPDITATYEYLSRAGFVNDYVTVKTQSWGERSFYMQDPFGNPLCFIDGATRFTGHNMSTQQESRQR